MTSFGDHEKTVIDQNCIAQSSDGSVAVIQSAREMCARHAGVSVDCVHEVWRKQRGRNALYVVSLHGDPGTGVRQEYFVKERLAQFHPERWRVDLDYAGLTHVAQYGPIGPSFGSIEPVGYSMKPRFLVTAYQSGPTLDAAISIAIKRGIDVEGACEYAGLLGKWLAAFRQSGQRPIDAEDAMDHSAVAIERLRELRTRNSSVKRSVPDSMIEALSECFLRGRTINRFARPAHGDMGPQNFILGEDGKIYPIDFSAFAYREFENDLSLCRVRFEKSAALGGRAAYRRATKVWRAFMNAYADSGESIDRCILAYIHRLAGLISSGTKRRGVREYISLLAIGRRIRDQVWIRGRYRWLSQMPMNSSGLSEYFVNEL